MKHIILNTNNQNNNITALSVSIFLVLFGIFNYLHAATITSTGSGNWSTGGTWVGGVAPANGDNVIIAATHTVTLTGGSNPTIASFTVTGVFQMNGRNATAGNVTGAGTITASSGCTFTVGDNTSTTFSGPITGSVILVKNGTGTLTLSGSNTYTGATTISAGTIKLGSTSALGTTAGATTVSNGAVLDLNGINYSTTEALTLTGTGISSGGALINSNATAATYAGNIALSTTTPQITATNPITLSGVLSSLQSKWLFALFVGGSGGLTLSGTNTFDGQLQINSGGLLKVGSATALGGDNTGSVDYNDNSTIITSGGVLDLNGITYNNTHEYIQVNGTGISNGGAVINSSATTANFNCEFSTWSGSTIRVDNPIILSGSVVWTGGAATNDLTVEGTSILTLSANLGAKTNDIFINSGATVKFGVTDALNTTGGGIYVNSGGVLDLNSFTLTRAITSLNGSGISGNGALTNSNATTATCSGGITLGSDATIGGTTGAITVSGTITGGGFVLTLTGGVGGTVSNAISGATTSLVKSGAGTWTLSAANTLQNVTVSAGTLTLGSTLTINGNLANNATLTAGTNMITFSGSGNATITGSSTTAFTGGITINKGASTDVVEVLSLITLSPTSTTDQMFLIQGVFKLSSASTITPFRPSSPSNSSPFSVQVNATFWCNHASAVVNSTGAGGTNCGSWSVAGTLRMTAGTVTIGTQTNDFFSPQTGSSIIVEGGTLSTTGRMSQGGAAWTFNMSGGTLTVGTLGSSSANRAVFNMDNSSCSFTMTGGTIIVERPGDLNKGFFNIATSGSGFTGGTLQIGDASTPAATTIKVETNQPIYNLTVNSANVTAQVATYSLAVSNNVTLTAGTLDPNALNISVGGNWTNNATYTTGTGGLIFNGTTSQTIGGSNSTTFYNLTLNNTGASGSDVITLSKPTTVSNTLTLTDGILATTATNLLTLTNSATTATNRGNGSGPSFVKGPIRWNGLNGAGPFVFPTGAGTSGWANVAVSGVTSSTDFTCQYFNTSYSNVSSAYLGTSPTPTLTTVSTVEYWDVTRTSGTGNAAVTLYWENATASGINSCGNNGNLKVAHYNTGTNKWENANSSGTIVVTGGCTTPTLSGTVKSDAMTSFSPFTFGSGSSGVNPLPIELLSFNAVFNGTTTDISWQTASEINNNYFTIERSTDGINFTTLATVPSKALNGNSTNTLFYTLNDPNTVAGVYYYRLKQTDFDFKYTYSNVVVVTITKSIGFSLDLAPNPNDGNSITGFITTPTSGMVTFKIYTVAGIRLCMEDMQVTEGEKSPFKIPFKEQIDAGTYIVIAILNGDLTTKKLMVVSK